MARMPELEDRRKKMVLALIRDRDYHPMRPREMAGILNVPRSERGELGAILDSLSAEGLVRVDAGGRYLPATDIPVEGVYQATDRGFGFVTIEGEEGDWFVAEEDTAGAIHGDRVTVVKIREGGRDHGKTYRTQGRIVAIVKRNTSDIVGIFKRNKIGGFVIPDRSRYDFDIAVDLKHTKGAVSGQKVCARITKYGDGRQVPQGEITEILGHVNDPGVDILSIVKDYGIPVDFPPEVHAEVATIPQELGESDYTGRKDLRDLLTVTIDGEEAKDLDDAISLTKNEDHYILGVHIADVSNYVREGSPLDVSAVGRGTSVYLADRVIPMLPHALSDGICSLNAGEDRLALSCIMELDGNGTVVSHEIAETVIRVDKRLSYTNVQKVFDGDTPEDYESVAPMLVELEKLSAIVRRNREKRGAIGFDLPECKILMDASGRVTSVEAYARNRATELIEDFMVLANETVAEQFHWLSLPFVYRVHEEPEWDKMRSLAAYVSHFGHMLHIGSDKVHSKDVQKLLLSIAGRPEEALLGRLTLRAMKQARYSTDCIGHFGLASRFYCHFTSPIRRYPDLQIHRIIKDYLHGRLSDARIAHYDAILPEVARTSGVYERRSEDAERDVEKMKKAEYMHRFLGEEFDGVISGVTSWGVYVELLNTVEGLVRLTDLRGDYYIYHEETMSLTGERSGRRYTIGQPMRVMVAAANKDARTVDFVPAER